VYLARLVERIPGAEIAVDDLCAVKVIRGDVATDIEHSRLMLAEGAVATRFRHPCAVRVLEVDRVGAEPFTAMDYIAGQTLSALLLRESSQGSVLPPEIVALIGADISAALWEASQRAWSPSGNGPMIHGGLSPRSVLIDYDGKVRVLGLGGGRARMHLPAPKSRLAYLPPELWNNKAPDRRTDLFALGAILHDAFTGQRLFRRASDAETKSAILTEPVPDVNAALASVGGPVATLVASMLERLSEKRPRDAEEVEEVLRPRVGDVAKTREALSQRIDRGFREDKEAQRRVVDAALRRVGASAPSRVTSSVKEAPRANDQSRPVEVAPIRRGGSGIAPRLIEPVLDVPQPPPHDGGPAFSELLPELMSGETPLLAERELDTVDLPDRSKPPTPNSRISAIPLTVRSSKPNSRDIMVEEATWDGPLEPSGPEGNGAPRWAADGSLEHTLDGAPTFAIATAADEPSDRPLQFAESEGSLEEVLVKPGEEPPNDSDGPGIARYRRSTLLGISELASVYLAGDAVLGRTVALKVSDIGDEKGARFDRALRIKVLRREARLAAGLFHPRLPVLLDAGRDGDVFFLAYQLVDGNNLDRVVAERGALSPTMVRPIVRDLADGLAYLHGRNLAHADLSPANVLIEPDGRARLVDFSMLASAGSTHPLGGELDLAAEALSLGKLGLWLLAGGAKPIDAQKLDPELAAILTRLVEPDKTKRWTDLAGVRGALDVLIDANKAKTRTSGERSVPPVPRSGSIPGPLDARERPGAPLGITYEALSSTLEAHFRRASAYEPPDRDPSGPLARAMARRLGLGGENEAASAILLAARSMALRFEIKARQAVAEGLVAPVLGARLLELEERLMGARAPDPEPTALEVAAVVEAYAQATLSAESGRRVSPRRAVLALRERADEGRFDGRVIEALIDHLRTTISALEIAPRERVMLVGVPVDGAVGGHVVARGHPVDVVADVDAAITRAASTKPWGVIAAKSLGRALAERLPPEMPLVIVGGGGLDDTLDDESPPMARVDVFGSNAPPEKVLGALLARGR